MEKSKCGNLSAKRVITARFEMYAHICKSAGWITPQHRQRSGPAFVYHLNSLAKVPNSIEVLKCSGQHKYKFTFPFFSSAICSPFALSRSPTRYWPWFLLDFTHRAMPVTYVCMSVGKWAAYLRVCVSAGFNYLIRIKLRICIPITLIIQHLFGKCTHIILNISSHKIS